MNNLVKALIGILLVGLISFGVYWLVVNQLQPTQNTDQTSSSNSSIVDSSSSSNSISSRTSSSSSSISTLPKLTNLTPQDGYQTNETTATLKGQVDAGTKVFIDGVETVVDDSRNFLQDVPLKIGENQVVLSLKNSNGAETKQVLTYTRSDSVQSSSQQPPQVEITNPSSLSSSATISSTMSSTSSSSSQIVRSNSSTSSSISSSVSVLPPSTTSSLLSSVPPVKPVRTGGIDFSVFLGLLLTIILAYFSFKILSLSWNKKI